MVWSSLLIYGNMLMFALLYALNDHTTRHRLGSACSLNSARCDFLRAMDDGAVWSDFWPKVLFSAFCQ